MNDVKAALVRRAQKALRSIDSGDDTGFARLDSALVDLMRVLPDDDPDILALRLAYAERQRGTHTMPIIVRSTRDLATDLVEAARADDPSALRALVLAQLDALGRPEDDEALLSEDQLAALMAAEVQARGGAAAGEAGRAAASIAWSLRSSLGRSWNELREGAEALPEPLPNDLRLLAEDLSRRFGGPYWVSVVWVDLDTEDVVGFEQKGPFYDRRLADLAVSDLTGDEDERHISRVMVHEVGPHDCREHSIRILFGFPALEAIEAYERGEVLLGGCIPGGVGQACRLCGLEW